MHKPLVSKIRVHNPNKAKSRVCNRNYLVYIGTREGVDLTNVEYLKEEMNLGNLNNTSDQESANNLYLKYIAERPNSNGLFGNVDCSDIEKLGSELYNLTGQGRNIYRGIVSLSGEDALGLGYTQNNNVRIKIFDIN